MTLCTLLLLITASELLPSALAVQCPTLTWSDEFNGSSLDSAKWEPQLGDGCAEGTCGWGNNELQHYKAENAVVGGGKLSITAKQERVKGRKYTSARIRTKGLGGDFWQGRFEAKIKIPTGQGIWPAFWMLPSNELLGGWPVSGEIDIMENIGREQSTIHGTIHYGDPYPNNRFSGGSFNLPGGQAFHTGFHEFAVDKKEGEIRWSVDGYEYFVRTASDIAPSAWPFDKTGELFHFILNVAVGGNWPGSPDGSTVFPQTMQVDYVRAYDVTMGRLVGPASAFENQQGVTYTVEEGVADYSYAWSVPPEATIVANDEQGTIVVDFGAVPGLVQVTATSAGCGISKVFTLPVELVPPPSFYGFEGHFVAPESAPGGEWTSLMSSSGTYSAAATDPLGIKGMVVEYVRNIDVQYDIIRYNVGSNINTPLDYVDGTRKFFIDVYAPDVPSCTEILIQLENGALASGEYPAGRHSRYSAKLDGNSAWQRLILEFVDQPDPSVAIVDRVVVLFDPNKLRGDVYYFDNFDSAVMGCVVSCENANDPPQCPGGPAQSEYGACDDGIDNDYDGSVDCADSNCLSDPLCEAPPPPASEAGYCTDGIDNDGDGQVDCADSDCSSDAACQAPPPSCVPSDQKIDGVACNDNNKYRCCSSQCSGGKPQSRTCA